jgi:hypothetical protein
MTWSPITRLAGSGYLVRHPTMGRPSRQVSVGERSDDPMGQGHLDASQHRDAARPVLVGDPEPGGEALGSAREAGP